MSWIALLLLAGIAALIDHGPLALWPIAPAAIIAVVAWAGVNASDRDVLARVWLVGLVADAVDPASTVFHSIAFLLGTVAFLPFRQLFFRRSLLAWAIWGTAMVPAIHFADVMTGGHAPVGGWAASLASGLMTGVLILPCGYLLNVLPPALHPLGHCDR